MSGAYGLKPGLNDKELYPVLATCPLELVHIDYIVIENLQMGKDENVLVITDHFTHYSQAMVMDSQMVQVTVKALWKLFQVHIMAFQRPYSATKVATLKVSSLRSCVV